MINFYLKDLQLGNFKKHCEWLHNNELPETDTYCPDCNTLILDNNTLKTWICYNCFRTFTQVEIIELNPNSKHCLRCNKKIMWYAEYCGDCTNKNYKIGRHFIGKIRLIYTKMNNVREFTCNYKWDYYEYDCRERQLKEINKTINSLKSLKKSIKNVDSYYDRIKPIKEEKGFGRWERRKSNDIKFGIKILKKEKELIKIKKSKKNVQKTKN